MMEFGGDYEFEGGFPTAPGMEPTRSALPLNVTRKDRLCPTSAPASPI